jgi:hypothetical protein
MTQKLFPSKPLYPSRIAHLVQMNTLSRESEPEDTPPDIDDVPISTEGTSSAIVPMTNAPDDDTDGRIVRSGNTLQDDQGTAVVTDSSPVVQDTALNPSLGTDADNIEGNSENITIIEGLRQEISNMRLQMANLQENYEKVVSSRDAASRDVTKLRQDLVIANLKLEQGDTQHIKTQAKLDTMEKMWKTFSKNKLSHPPR